ncbi:MAG: triose-phosphate isomerase [Burkholderiales bacterium]|nr:triose-phosphate isomerase [Burkholderiales bacterium]OUT76366.1 MAG: triose-phosphate isomerase [Betaproteobacteria bacterium TMED22]|tara:strand:- start:1232 stop:1984 length:753 start_codon:yes stop_codon:yes gene_type:complete
MNRKQLVVGNWKMNGSLSDNEALLVGLSAADDLSGLDVSVCVPYLYLAQTREHLAAGNISWGGQNVSEHDAGAYTGEISGSMLADFEVSFGLVGHSERRSFYAETNELVGIKARKLLSVGITPIVCVGETLKQREAEETFGIISAQLEAVIEQIGLENLGRLVLAYEPVWAIGTGLTASPEQAQEVHEYLREQVALLDEAAASSLRILYGGSVKPDNAEKLFRQADVDGGLIGGASLNLIDFLTICRLAI